MPIIYNLFLLIKTLDPTAFFLTSATNALPCIFIIFCVISSLILCGNQISDEKFSKLSC
jgi:hypothetical protein